MTLRVWTAYMCWLNPSSTSPNLVQEKNESLCLWSYSCAATLRPALSPTTKELYVIPGCTHCSWSWPLRLASPWRSRSQSHWSRSPRPSRASSSWSWTQSWPSLSTTSTSPNWQIRLNLVSDSEPLMEQLLMWVKHYWCKCWVWGERVHTVQVRPHVVEMTVF